MALPRHPWRVELACADHSAKAAKSTRSVSCAESCLTMEWECTLLVLSVVLGWRGAFPDADQFLFMICFTNLVMLVFNLLPVFPLDGGQILRDGLTPFRDRPARSA